LKRPTGFLVRLALAAIRGYQRHLSPHKGFSCAYRVATGRASCSHHGYRVIERCGLWTGLALLRRRLRLCGEVHRSRLAARTAARNPVLHYQRGDCVPCDCDASCLPDLPCDMSDVSWRDADCVCDACQCVDCGNCANPKQAWRDWKARRRQRKIRRLFS